MNNSIFIHIFQPHGSAHSHNHGKSANKQALKLSFIIISIYMIVEAIGGFEVLAAFINGLTLMSISLYIFWESYLRLSQSPQVLSTGMLIIASIGRSPARFETITLRSRPYWALGVCTKKQENISPTLFAFLYTLK
ncbi:cation transporter [Paenibacillus agricola]|uniref:Cation transporter n=1 Tax=Paenibacillus agricola TaxID=2716264 RepID=A0ABX0IWZ3_9BACL|nr:cation transporter [Paenibacillus agricola]